MNGDDARRPDQATLTATDAIGPVAPEPPAATLSRGAALGRYLVIDRLGGGGMGVVYSAYDPELDRKLAVKVLRPEAAADQSRLVREARAMARLSHPNVIAVHDVGTLDGRIFVAMELVDGETLSDWLAREPHDWPAIVQMFAQAGRGLAAAHAVGLVHRDFKPANVLVGRDGRVRVVDFGLARAVVDLGAPPATPPAVTGGIELTPSSAPSLHETITHSGALLGTPSYMPPEMWQGRAADARSDQFSFSVALYRALWRARPFGDDDELQTIAREVIAGRVRPPPKESRVPPWLRDVVMRGLAADPAQRWPSMEAMLAALTRTAGVRRRRLIVAGGAVLALVAAVAGVRVWAARDVRACRAGSRRIAEVWDDARRGAMHRAFAASGIPYADSAFATASAALDAFVESWATTYVGACEATRVRHDQSDELYDLRMQCLSDRLQDAQADVELLTHADRGVVANARRLTAGLTTKACSNVAALRGPVPPPSDAASKARLNALHARFSRMTALDLAGKHREADALATPLAADARAFGYKSFTAQVLYWQGWIKTGAGDYKAADATLEEAVLAARASRSATTEVNAYTSLTWNAEREGQFERGRALARHAFAAYEAGGAEEHNLAWALFALGSLEADAGNPLQALQYSERGLAIREKLAAERPADLAVAHEAVARALGDLGRYREQAEQVRQELAIYDKLGWQDHPDYASALFNLAFAQVGEGKLADGLASYRAAFAIWQRTLGPEHPQLVVGLANQGDILLRLGRVDEALANNRRALALSEKVLGEDHWETAMSSTNLGEVLLRLGKIDDAIALFRRSIAIADKGLPPDHPQRIGAIVDLGMADVARHQPARAIEPVERVLRTLDAQGTNTFERAEARYVLATALWNTGRDRARARELALAARPLYEKENREDRLAALDAWLATHR